MLEGIGNQSIVNTFMSLFAVDDSCTNSSGGIKSKPQLANDRESCNHISFPS